MTLRSRVWRIAVVVALLGLAPTRLRGSDVVTYESITVAATAIGITAAILNPVGGQTQQSACSLRLETAQIRFRFDGPDPTAAEGTTLEIGEVLDISNNADARRIRFIRTGATSGTLKANCWR